MISTGMRIVAIQNQGFEFRSACEYFTFPDKEFFEDRLLTVATSAVVINRESETITDLFNSSTRLNASPEK